MDFGSRKKRRGAAEMNITPLIDIVFQLLIFFLITTTFVQNPGIDVELPKAHTQPGKEQTENVIVAITEDGMIIHEGRSVSMEELGGRLADHFQQRPTAVVIVQADTDTSHGQVVEVMDLAREVGFAQLAIATAAME